MLNKVTLIGNLGADPDVRYMPTGGAVTHISLATTRRWKDRNSGERRDETEWHRVVFFGRLAEVVGEYLKKGRQVYIEGRIHTNKWQDKEGVDRYTTEIIASEMQMLGSRDGGGTASFGDASPSSSTVQNSAPASVQHAQAATAQTTSTPETPPPAAYEDFDDDIPF